MRTNATARRRKLDAEARLLADPVLAESADVLNALLERYADDPNLDSPLDERARALLAKLRGELA